MSQKRGALVEPRVSGMGGSTFPGLKATLCSTMRTAGAVIKDYFIFRSNLVTRMKKSAQDVVTQADHASQKILVAELHRLYPSFGIIAEEDDVRIQPDADFVFHIDPLDGTNNFARGISLFGIIVGLAHQGSPVAGAVYLPFDGAREFFIFAEAGKGAWKLNHVPARCSQVSIFADTTGIGGTRPFKKRTQIFSELGGRITDQPWMLGIASAAVGCAWVADARADWYFSAGSKSWDYTGPAVILAEAGCKVTNGRGEPWKVGDKELIAANPVLHAQLFPLAHQALLAEGELSA